jgi:hypothetical protein
MDNDGKIAAVVVDWIYIGVIRMKKRRNSLNYSGRTIEIL